jgi:hypothetical protein
MKEIIKKYYKGFLLRGLMVMGGGPIVLAIVYAILELCGVEVMLNGWQAALGIIAIAALAFVAAGVTVVYQIEELPLIKAIGIHGAILYIAYAIVYLVNGWLVRGYIPFLIFTAIFIVGYLAVWGIIYLVIKRNTDKINAKITEQNK